MVVQHIDQTMPSILQNILHYCSLHYYCKTGMSTLFSIIYYNLKKLEQFYQLEDLKYANDIDKCNTHDTT